MKTAALLAVAGCTLSMSGCLGLQARAVTAPQPLEVPPPPPRVVEVQEPQAPPPIPLPEEPTRSAPPVRPPEPPRPVPPARAEPAGDATKPPDDGATKPPAATNLQTTPVRQEGELERRIRALLFQAGNDLGRINYQSLNADARTQYDTAKRFIAQAEDAVRDKNLVFANNLADKAAQLAAQLSGR